MFCKKGVLRNFAKFTGKHLYQSLFLTKLQTRVTSCNLIKKKTLVQVFYSEFCELSKNTFFYKTPPVAAFDTCVIGSYGDIIFRLWWLTLSWRSSYHIETNPIIFRANQWTGFYMIRSAVKKELKFTWLVVKLSLLASSLAL